jgi:hypothetical protein
MILLNCLDMLMTVILLWRYFVLFGQFNFKVWTYKVKGLFSYPSRRSNKLVWEVVRLRFFQMQQAMKKSLSCWTKFTAAVFDLGVMSSSYSDSWIERVLIQMLVLPVGIFWSFVMTWPSLYVGWIFASWIVVSLASAGFACSVQCRIR